MLKYICVVPRISKYWLFQTIGWFSFAFLNIYIAILTQELSAAVIGLNVFVAVIGFSLTHVFRAIILSYHLNMLPTEKLVIRVAVSIFLMSIVFNLLYYTAFYFIYHDVFLKLKASAFAGSFIAACFLFSLWSILYFAWTYVEYNRRNLIERLQMESAMKDLELRTLRSNLQPHFIFNSLNSIRALIDENPELARRAITRISNILRSSITRQETTDSLSNEIQITDDYLALEKIRFEERLTYSKEIDPASLDIQIPTMMLQTLVENAIKHGISTLEKGGHIHVKSTFKEGLFELEVVNTGSLKTHASHQDSLGFGLHATRQRLSILYPEHARFSIQEKEGQVHALVQIETNKNQLP
jgi:two-component system, LytTR family, sensor kinase